MQEEKENKALLIKQKYIEIIHEKKRIPVYGDFLVHSISRDAIRHHYGNINNLHRLMENEEHEEISKSILTGESVFNPRNLKQLNDTLAKYKRFVISTYVSGKPLFVEAYNAVRKYCEINDATLLLMPCQDVANRFSETYSWIFDPITSRDSFIYQDTKLNSNLFLSSIRLSAKHINPTTGLSRIGQKNGSYIFASPKQYLEFVVNSPDVEIMPAAIMTTGAITKPEYQTDRYLSERTSYIAENDHVNGALIVEIQDERIFHFRQIQFGMDGSFVDLGVKYTHAGTEKVSSTLIMGDYHAGETDEQVKKATKEICDIANVRDIFVHDMFDGRSINHYDDGKPLAKAYKAMTNQNSLMKELKIGGEEFNWLLSIVDGEIYRVKSNHDDRIEKYLLQGKYIDDPINHYISLDLARALLDGKDVSAYAYLTYGNITDPSRIVWLSRDEECKIAGVECGQHGDLGLNGSRASLNGVEKAYGSCIVGHSHTGAIMRGVFRVGTSTKLKVDYNKGPSSWTNTHCLLYDNGSRQLINMINGDWKI